MRPPGRFQAAAGCLCLGIAEAGVELQHLRTARGHHQPAVEHAGEGRSFLGHAANGGLGNVVQNPLRHGGIEQLVSGVDAHAAGVGAGVALADALVVLGGNQRRHMLAVAQARKLISSPSRNSSMTTCCAASPSSVPVNSPCAASTAVCRDGQMMTPLPAASPSALTTMGAMKKVDGLFHFGRGGADGEVAGGNVVALQELLGEALAGFKHGRGARGPKNPQAALLKSVHNAQRKRQLRPHDGQSGLLSLSQTHHRIHILQVDWNTARNLGNAAVAGRANNLSYLFAAFYCPGQRMLAAPGTKDQDLHECTPSKRANRDAQKVMVGNAGG